MNNFAPRHQRLLILIVCILIAAPAALTAQSHTVAVLPFVNSSGDIRSDYLGKIAEALLMYDLTSQNKIELVSRDELDAIMQEKQLALSGLVEEGSELRELGGLSGADYLIRGEYVHLGDDLLFIIKLISVDDGEVTVIRERGTNENTVHRISEAVVRQLTGSSPEFTSEDGRRSIISLKSENPGTLALYSPLIDAEIYLDDKFVGYTTGDPTVPFIIEQVRPGPHTLRTHLSSNFGVIDLPEIRFRDWSEEVDIRPDQRTVARDQSRHFNSFLYEMQWLLREDVDFKERPDLESFSGVKPYEFTGRDGVLRSGSLTIEAAGSSIIRFTLTYGNLEESLELTIPDESGSNEQTINLELVELEAEISRRYYDWRVSYALTRTDVYQGMHRDE
ncbi:MAG: CsgG/HfaB family protein [Spirochaetota bacterium]|nr:CsgG/HfaB family protein [Spirochaetota bacterium]